MVLGPLDDDVPRAADAVPDDGWPSLRRVLCCGEVLPTPVLRHWMDRLPHATFTNLYGPTEATIASSFYTFGQPPTDDTAPIPIGVPCAGEELLVLDDGLQPAPVGETGGLYIAGVGLSPGYWRDEERTDAAFVRDPSDAARRASTGPATSPGSATTGSSYFLGRVDSQIKSRGYRIELGEIETALNALDAIQESAVVGCRERRLRGHADLLRVRPVRREPCDAGRASDAAPGGAPALHAAHALARAGRAPEERERQDRPTAAARAAGEPGGRDDERGRMSAPVVERLRALFPTALYMEPPAPDADLIDGGVLDSLALVELLAAIEVEFSIEVPLDELELERIRTLDGLADLVSERIAHATPGAA